MCGLSDLLKRYLSSGSEERREGRRRGGEERGEEERGGRGGGGRYTYIAPNEELVLLWSVTFAWRRSLAFTLCTTAPSVGLITIDSTGNLGPWGRGEWGGGISYITVREAAVLGCY